MGFLDTVIKDSGNEFASKVSEGIAAGDITSYIDTGSYIFNALVSGRFMEVFLLIKLLHLQESQAQVKHSLL